MELELRQILPSFELAHTKSDIWGASCTFTSTNRRYLIKAPSGNGKTTFQKILHGTYKTFSGDVLINDSSIKSMSASGLSIYRSKVTSFIFQDLRLLNSMTAMENVLVKNELTGSKTNEEILFYFDALGITALMDKPCGEMSYGQQQRVAIIRSLCQPFHFLICDEPFSHLDDHNIQRACSLIENELNARQSSLIMLSHDHGYSFQYAEHFNL